MKTGNGFGFSHPPATKELAEKYLGKMTDPDLGKLIGVHKSTIYGWRKEAGIPAFKKTNQYVPPTVQKLWIPHREYQNWLSSWKRPEGLSEEIAKIRYYRFLLHLYEMEKCV